MFRFFFPFSFSFFFYSKALQQIWKSQTWFFTTEVKLTFFPPSFIPSLLAFSDSNSPCISIYFLFTPSFAKLLCASISGRSPGPRTFRGPLVTLSRGSPQVRTECISKLVYSLGSHWTHLFKTPPVSALAFLFFFLHYSRRTSLQIFISRGIRTILPRT